MEDKIQYIKYRPSQPFDSNTPINFTIPRNFSQYISLHESDMYVEQTDQFGNPITTSNTSSSSTPAACSRRNVVKEVDDEEEDEEEEEEDMDQEEEEEKPIVSRSVPSDPHPFPTSARDIQEYLDEAEHRYIKWQRALTSFKNETNVQEKAKKKVLAVSLEDMAISSMCQYLLAKHMRRKKNFIKMH